MPEAVRPTPSAVDAAAGPRTWLGGSPPSVKSVRTVKSVFGYITANDR